VVTTPTSSDASTATVTATATGTTTGWSRPGASAVAPRRAGRVGLRAAALGYLALIVLGPVVLLVVRTFAHGVGPVVDALTAPPAVHAVELSLLLVAITVPVNTVFGVVCAFVLVRYRPPGAGLLAAVVDLPFAISPVVLGLALFTLYGRTGWLGPALAEHGVDIIFALPGMVLATIFVSLPFVVNEVAPVLAEAGVEAEQAAASLGASAVQTLWRITLPAIRWGVTYGVVLTTARALGEFGAVAIVSGNLVGETQTLPLYVEDRFISFDLQGAYAAALLLGLIAVAVLVVLTRLSHRADRPSLEDEEEGAL
jgi:sulfate/thiosulfate transport system permease protein